MDRPLSDVHRVTETSVSREQSALRLRQSSRGQPKAKGYRPDSWVHSSGPSNRTIQRTWGFAEGINRLDPGACEQRVPEERCHHKCRFGSRMPYSLGTRGSMQYLLLPKPGPPLVVEALVPS
jgi:hypothetical protein